MSINSSKSRIASLTRDLANKWEDTKESWRDAKSDEFEQKYMAELFAGVDHAVAVIDQLDKVIRKIRSDCE